MRIERSNFTLVLVICLLPFTQSSAVFASTIYKAFDRTGKVTQESENPISLPGAKVHRFGRPVDSANGGNEFNAPPGFKKSYEKGEFIVIAPTNQHDERIGLCDQQGNVIIPPFIAAEIETLGDDTFLRTRFSTDGDKVVELIAKGGKVLAVLPNEIHARGDFKFSQGILKVEGESNAIGYINKQGEFIVKPLEFQAGDDFSEGLANVTYQDNRCGYIDRTGKLVIGPFAKGATYPFKRGIGIIWDGEKYQGALDKNGKFLIPLEYESLGQCDDGTLVGKHGDHFEILSNQGKVLVKLPSTISQVYASDGTVFPFAEGGVAKPNQAAHEPNDKAKWGYLDSTGKILIEPKYDMAQQFTGALAVVGNLAATSKDTSSVGKQYSYGVVDKTGKEVLQPIYESATIFDGIIVASLRQNDTKQPDFNPIDWSREGSSRKWAEFLRAYDIIGMTREQINKHLGKTHELTVPTDSSVSGSRVGISLTPYAMCGNAASSIQIDFNKEGKVFRWRLGSISGGRSNWIEDNVVLLDDFKGITPGNLVPKSEGKKSPGA